MGLLIAHTDFIGGFLLPAGDKLDPYILRHEEDYLAKLLGVELFDLFKADVSGTTKLPQAPLFLNIYNAFRKQPTGGQYQYFSNDPYFGDVDFPCWDQASQNKIYTSRGIKDMLLGFIYWEYARQVKFKSTDAGVLIYSSVDGREIPSTELHSFLRLKYNQSIETYKSIQWWIVENKADYPTFKGLNLKFDYGFF